MSPKVSQEHKLATQDRIVTAAESVFSQKGYYETSMDDIVKASGLSKGAIYGYFKSKESLFLEVQKRYSGPGIDELKEALSQETSATAKLEKAAALAISSMCDIPEAACRMDLEFQVASSRMNEMKGRLKAQHLAIIDFIADIIDEGIRSGEFRGDLDSHIVATILVGAVGGMSTASVTTGIKVNWDRIRESLVPLVLRGIMK